MSCILQVILFILMATPLRAAISMVQANQKSMGNVSSVTLPFGSNTAAGNLLIACVSWSNTQNFVSVADSQGNAFTQFGNELDDGEKARCYYAKNIIGGADSITFTLNASAGVIEMYIHEVSGVSYASPFDQACSTTAGGGTISCSVTTTAASEILFGYNQDGTSHLVGGSGFTAVTTFNGNLSEYKVVSSTGTYAINASESGSGVLIGGAFKGPTTPTEIKLSSFTATEYAGGQVAIRWRTGFEVDNLGFHLYREAGGQKVELTRSLLAGSALFAGEKTSLTTGNSYTWPDTLPPNSSPAQYWLEEVDLHGKHIWHGPIVPSQESASRPPSPTSPPLLKELGLGLKPTALKSRASVVPAETQADRSEDHFDFQETDWDPELQRIQPQLRTQWTLAASPAIKIGVRSNGWYRVTQADLIAAGLGPGINPRTLRLFADGKEVPIVVNVDTRGRLQPAGIEFYGVGLDTPYTDTRVYWLAAGGEPGKRLTGAEGQSSAPQIETLSDSGFDRASISPAFPYTVERSDRSVYVAAIKNGDGESFFGSVITSDPVDQDLVVRHLDLNVRADAQIEVVLQGTTLGDHRVSVQVNGHAISPVVFTGQVLGNIKAPIPQSWLREGENKVTLASELGDSDVSAVKYIRLTYWHSYVVDGDSLRITTSAQKKVEVRGFNDSQIRVLDITDATDPEAIPVVVRRDETGYSATFSVRGPGSRTVLAVSEASVDSAAWVVANHSSSWHKASHGYDEVIISNAAFIQVLQPLVNLRKQQGLSVAVVDVQDVYDEFNYGAKDPSALKNFIGRSLNSWQKPPRFVMLVGDATFDPRNYLDLGDFDFVPTKFVDTAYLKTASDDWYVAGDDDLPVLPIGRLPVRTLSEAETVVSKIVRNEQVSPAETWRKNVLLVADSNDSFNFQGATSQLTALLPGGAQVSKIFRGQSDDATTSALLLNMLNKGQGLVNYFGHGSVELWDGNLLTSEATAKLTNQSRLPFLIAMTCLNGYFQDVYTVSLAKAMVLSPGGGAVAVWASSGLSAPDGQAPMDLAVIDYLFEKATRLGEATLAAKQKVSDPDIRHTWIFFGDPATKRMW